MIEFTQYMQLLGYTQSLVCQTSVQFILFSTFVQLAKVHIHVHVHTHVYPMTHNSRYMLHIYVVGDIFHSQFELAVILNKELS